MASRVAPICSSYSSGMPNVFCSMSSDCFSEFTATAMCSTRLIFIATLLELGQSGGREHVLMCSTGLVRPRCGKRRVALKHRHHTIGEQAHVQLALLMRHTAIREVGDNMISPAQRT